MIQFLIKRTNDGTVVLATIVLRDGEVISERVDCFDTYEKAREKIPEGYVIRKKEEAEIWTVPCLRSVR